MADLKISELAANPSISTDDLLPIVNDPAGTPVTNMVTVGNLFASSSFSSAVSSLNYVLKTATTTSGFGFVVDEDDMASNSATKVPTQQSVRAYVLANAGGAGDVSSTDTDASSWTFVNATGALTSNTTTLPTDDTVKTYVDDSITALPTLTTSDTGKVPVSTAGGITTIDVSGLLTSTVANFSDAAFTLQSSGDATKQALFSLSGIPTATTMTYTLPIPATGTSATLLSLTATQTVTNKTYSAADLASNTSTSAAITLRGGNRAETNDGSRSQLVEIFTSPGTGSQTLGFQHVSGSDAAPSASASGVLLGRISARGATSVAGTTPTYATGAQARIEFKTTEAVTTSAWGSVISFVTTPATTILPTETFKLTSDAVQGAVLRGSIAVGAGSGMASATSGYGVEVKSGAIGYGTGVGSTVTQGTNRDTGVTINNVCGAITLFSTTGGTGTWHTFTVTNSTVAATDVVKVCQKSGTDKYMTHVSAVAAGSFAITYATTGGNTSEAPVFNFAVLKAVTS